MDRAKGIVSILLEKEKFEIKLEQNNANFCYFRPMLYYKKVKEIIILSYTVESEDTSSTHKKFLGVLIFF